MPMKRDETSSVDSRGGSIANRFADDESRWQAIVRRDRNADDVFYYAVKTTGVYCRPSCAAKLAKRENVLFYTTCKQAEQGGFRPCRRCRPTEPPLAERQLDTVAQACRLMEDAEETWSLANLAQAVGMSRYYFHRIFKQVTGVMSFPQFGGQEIKHHRPSSTRIQRG